MQEIARSADSRICYRNESNGRVPYIKGLDKFLGNQLTDGVKAYLKDMGAASASNSAVGLYHIENLTPEAVKHGEALIKEGAEIYTIDDKELERVYESYPVMWKNHNAKPKLCFIGVRIYHFRSWLTGLINCQTR